jgi:OTU-like cysteine protease
VDPPTKPLVQKLRLDDSCTRDTDLASSVSFGGQDLSISLAGAAPLVSSTEINRPEENSGNSTTTVKTMAVGGRPRSEDDEDSCAGSGEPTELHAASPRLMWTHPVENEPPMFQNHPPVPFTLQVVNHHGTPDPASDDERDLPESPVPSGDLAATPKCAGAPIATKHNRHAASDFAMARLCEALKAKGLEIVEQEGDGNCLFRAVSLQVYGSADNHGEVRERCMDFMARNEEHYSNFVAIGSCDTDADAIPESRADTAFQDYVARKRINGVHGNHAEIQAISELFNRPVEVYTPPAVNDIGQPDTGPLQPMNIHAEYKTSDPPIRLSFHDGNHYNAIIDPLVPTAGLGLGLPGLKPGLADQMQVTKAKAESDRIADEVELQRVLKESHEEKDAELQQVLQETSMDYVSLNYLKPHCRLLHSSF